MEGQPKCIKCGRILKSSTSIARGMGSKCAGGRVSSGKTFQAKFGGRSGSAYQNTDSTVTAHSVLSSGSTTKPLRKRAETSRIKAERRRLFDERKPFQCGVLTRTHAPLIYIPAGNGAWKESHSGRSIPHEALQNYLERYNLI